MTSYCVFTSNTNGGGEIFLLATCNLFSEQVYFVWRKNYKWRKKKPMAHKRFRESILLRFIRDFHVLNMKLERSGTSVENDRLDRKPQLIFLHSKGNKKIVQFAQIEKYSEEEEKPVFFSFLWNVRKKMKLESWKLFNTLQNYKIL